MYKCVQGHFTNKEHDGKNCPYDNMSASELSSALVIDTEKKAREKYQAVMSGNPSRDLGKQPRINIQLFANKNLSKMGIIQITKSIKSFEKQKAIHLAKIKDFPDSIHREHWEKEIDAINKNIKEHKEELEKRR